MTPFFGFLLFVNGIIAVLAVAGAAHSLGSTRFRPRKDAVAGGGSEIPAADQALKTAGVGLFEINFNRMSLSFSPDWKAILGYKDREVASHYEWWEENVHPEDLSRAKQALADYLAHRAPFYNVDYRMRHKDQSWRWIQARGQATWDENGRQNRLVGTHIDVTEQRHATAQLRRERDNAQRKAAETAGELLKLAGEVSTSLDQTLTMINVLLKTRLQPEQRECAEAIEGWSREGLAKMTVLGGRKSVAAPTIGVAQTIDSIRSLAEAVGPNRLNLAQLGAVDMDTVELTDDEQVANLLTRK